MEKEASEDSYCTTDEGEGNKDQKEEEEQIIEITEKKGDLVKVCKEAIKKEILNVGDSKSKPFDIDNVICEYRLTFENGEIIESSNGKVEIDLGESFMPEGFNRSILTMRKNEMAKFYIRAKYGFKNLNENVRIPEGYESEEKLEKLKNSNLIYEVTLYDWFIVQNLMDNQEIKKKIVSNGTKWIYPKLSDFVRYSLSLYQDKALIYEKYNRFEEIDKTQYFEIEKRVIQNTKFGEKAEINVKAVYMRDKNSDMIKHYNLDKEKNVLFKVEIHDIQQYEYVYNVVKDKYSKKHVMKKGIGNDSPDRECFVKMKLQIWHEDKLLYDNFKEDIQTYIDRTNNNDEYLIFREDYFKRNNLENVELSENLDIMEKLYIETKIENSVNCDLRDYSIPIILRKVLVHMKRNEIIKIVTKNVDYFFIDNVEIYELKGNFTIYCQMFEFLNVIKKIK